MPLCNATFAHSNSISKFQIENKNELSKKFLK